jgi:hypothetical protein
MGWQTGSPILPSQIAATPHIHAHRRRRANIRICRSWCAVPIPAILPMGACNGRLHLSRSR